MIKNLFALIPRGAAAESIDVLARGQDVRIERIVSRGQVSPPGFWYDQHESEWVAVLQGEAQLRLEGEAQPRHLKVGDFLNIPAHCRHRVEWTSDDPPTIWLAVFYSRSALGKC